MLTADKLADAERMDLSDFVDTARYPLHDPESDTLGAVIEEARA